MGNYPVSKRDPEGKFLPRVYVCYRASAPIVIDGNIDKKPWRDAEWTELFEDHEAPNTSEPYLTTRAAILWDDDGIYFAGQMQEPNVWASMTVRDTHVCDECDFEVFMDVDGNGSNYYEVEVNPLNTVWDLFYHKESGRWSGGQRAFSKGVYVYQGLRHAVQIQGTLNYHYDVDVGWTCEIKLPWSTIKEHFNRPHIPPKRGQLMRVNFSRVQWHHDYSRLYCAKLPGVNAEDWAWSSTNNGSLHVTDMWGKVYFSDLPAGTEKDIELEFLARKRPLPPPPSPGRVESAMVYIPPCRFTMGPDPTDPDVSPAHQVELGSYWMDRYPVTVAEYAAFLNATGREDCYFKYMANPDQCGITRDADGTYRVTPGRERHPIVYVTHAMATAYAEWVGKKLPTEAQWERAARGLEGRTYPWGNEPIDPSRANFDFHYGGTTAVGSFPTGATSEGIHDLCGNVNEWCREFFDNYPGGVTLLDASTGELIEGTLPDGQPIQKGKGVAIESLQPLPERARPVCPVQRGGGWTVQELNAISARRDADTAETWNFALGFRCVKEEGE